jgi:hypothetical protein
LSPTISGTANPPRTIRSAIAAPAESAELAQ